MSMYQLGLDQELNEVKDQQRDTYHLQHTLEVNRVNSNQFSKYKYV